MSKTKAREWQKHFANFSKETWRAASSVIHEETECPSFTANSMAAEWKEIWVPDASTYDEDQLADRWRHYAEKIKDELPKSSKPLNWMPSYQEFQAAAGKASGGAGFDGWHYRN